MKWLDVGQRIAFDTTRARLWVVCSSCDQWNLVPIEERWEALEECERLADKAEVRAHGTGVGVARTASGLELLRATGISDADIANARYGRRIEHRQYVLMSIFVAFGLAAIALGIWMTIFSKSPLFGVYFGAGVGYYLFWLWRNPPRGWLRVHTPSGRRAIVWPWNLRHVRFESTSEERPPVLIVPGLRGDLRIKGDEIVDFLAGLLPKLNGADCVDASIGNAVHQVSEAEARSRREPERARRRKSRKSSNTRPSYRPWQWLAFSCAHRPLVYVGPENRLALEMAVMEEIERRELVKYADSVDETLTDEGEIAAIADDLLVAPQIKERLGQLRAAVTGAAKQEPTE